MIFLGDIPIDADAVRSAVGACTSDLDMTSIDDRYVECPQTGEGWARVDFAVLGPLQVRQGDLPLALGSPKQQTVLALLVVSYGEALSLDEMIDELWGEDPPASAVANARGYAAALRRLLSSADRGRERVIRAGSGYQLGVDESEVDVGRFRRDLREGRRALAQGDNPAALTSFQRALSHWRGRMVDGLPRGRLLESRCATVERDRLEVVDSLAEVHLQLGQAAEASNILQTQVQAEPLREQSYALLMRAQYQVAGAAAALKVYQTIASTLADQLGVDPDAELRRLHRAVLNRDPRLDPPAPHSAVTVSPPESADSIGPAGHDVDNLAGGTDPLGGFQANIPRTLPPLIRDFTGRVRDVSLLCDALRPGPQTRTPVVVVAGPGGVGKTALCIQVAHELSPHFPDGQLYANLHGYAPDGAITPYEVLGRFLRLLGVEGSAVPETVDERSELYRGLLAERRVLVVLDNAERDEQVVSLLPGGYGCAVMVNSRHRIGLEFGADLHSLNVFASDEAAELLSRLGGPARTSAEPAAVNELARLCDHLPLALRVAGGRLAAKPHWSVSKLVALLIDERSRLDRLTHGSLSVRASIALSYRNLPKAAQRLLRRLGDMDLPEVSLLISAALLDSSLQEAEDALEQLHDAQLIDVSTATTSGRARYRLHQLVRLFAAERAGSDESRVALAAARQRVYSGFLTVLHSLHLQVFGGQQFQGEQARWTLDDAAVSTLAPDPLEWLDAERQSIRTAANRAAADGHSSLCWELVCALSMLFQLRGYYDDLPPLLDAALTAAQVAADRRGQAAVLHRRGGVYSDLQENQRAHESFQRAAGLFADVGDRHGEALAMTYLATIDRWSGQLDQALGHYQRALQPLRDRGDRGGEAFVLRSIGQVYLDRGEYAAAERHFDRALAAARASGASRSVAQVRLWQGMMRLRQHDFEAARTILTEVLDMARGVQDRYGQAHILRGLALCYQGQGDRHRAEAVLSEALALVRQPRPTFIEAMIESALADVRQE